MQTTTNTRTDIRSRYNRACENHAAAYDRSDSTNTRYWADQMARLERLLNRM